MPSLSALPTVLAGTTLNAFQCSCVGYFKAWWQELLSSREDKIKAESVGKILQRNLLGRILQAWRVANQEACIIEPLVKRRARRDLARFV